MEATSLDDSSIAKVSIMKTKKKSLFAWFGRTVAVGLVPLMMVGCATDSSNNDKDDTTTTNIDLTYSTEPISGQSIVGSSVIKVTFSKPVTGFTVDSDSTDTSYGSVYLTRDDGSYVPMTFTQSGSSYILDPTSDLVTGNYNLVIGFGGVIKDTVDGAAAQMTTTVVRVDDALNTMTTNLTASLNALAGLSVGDATAIVTKATQGASVVANNVGAVVPAAMEAAFDQIAATAAITDPTAAMSTVVSTLMSMVAASSDNLDAEGRKIARIGDTNGFTTLLNEISLVFTRQAVAGNITVALMDDLVAAVQDNLRNAGASSDQVTTYSQTFSSSLSQSLNSVTDSTFDSTPYVAAVNSSVSTATSAQAISLKTDIENSGGGAGDDTFYATNTTLQAGDQLTGGAGTDTLVINASTAGTLAGFIMTGVERVSATNYAGALVVNLGASTDVTSVSATGTQDVTFTDVSNIVGLTAKGTTDVTVTYQASVVSGTADSQEITVDAFGSTTEGDITIAGVETVSITASGSASTIDDLTLAAAKTLNINASANLTVDSALSGTAAALTSIDASASTGKISLKTEDDGTKSIKLGSGDDTLQRNVNSADDTVDAGAGTDTLAVTTGANATSAKLANYSNFEKLSMVGNGTNGDVTLTLTNVSWITEIIHANADNETTTYNGVGAGVPLTITKGDNASVSGFSEDAVVFDLATDTTKDNVSVKIGPASGTTAVTLASLTLNDFETINIESTGANNSIDNITSSDATKMVVTGDKNLAVLQFPSTSNLKTIDASAMTGAIRLSAAPTTTMTLIGGAGSDNLTGGTSTDNITGGAGNDTIAGNGGNDVIAGGDGDDTITLGTLTDKTVNVTGGAGNDSVDIGDVDNLTSTDIVDGGAGTDTLILTARGDLSSTAAINNLLGLDGFEAVQLGKTGSEVSGLFLLGSASMAKFGSDISITSKNTSGTVTLDARNVLSSNEKVTFKTASTANDNHTYVIGNGVDTVDFSTMATTTATDAQNQIVVPETFYLSSSDSFVGYSGEGDNVTFIDNETALTSPLTISAAQLETFTGFETISVEANATTKYSFTVSDAAAAANVRSSNNRFDIIAGPGNSATLSVDGSAVTTVGLKLLGGGGNDSLTGGAESDNLTGGLGDNTLVGGAGNDIFHITGKSDNATRIDTITDFNAGTSTTSVDKLVFDNATLSGFGLNSAWDNKTTSDNGTISVVAQIVVITGQSYANAAALGANSLGINQDNSSIYFYQDTLGNVRVAAVGATVADLVKITNYSISTLNSVLNAGDIDIQ